MSYVYHGIVYIKETWVHRKLNSQKGNYLNKLQYVYCYTVTKNIMNVWNGIGKCSAYLMYKYAHTGT